MMLGRAQTKQMESGWGVSKLRGIATGELRGRVSPPGVANLAKEWAGPLTEPLARINLRCRRGPTRML